MRKKPAFTGSTSTLAKPAAPSQVANGFGANDGADGRRRGLGQRHGEAMDDAPAVHEALDFVARRMERIRHLLVRDEKAASGRKRLTQRSQYIGGARHVMQRFEHDDQIEGAVLRDRNGIANL